jgi:hypothetical protein
VNPILDRLDLSPEHGQRSAQFVRDVGDPLLAGPVGRPLRRNRVVLAAPEAPGLMQGISPPPEALVF